MNHIHGGRFSHLDPGLLTATTQGALGVVERSINYRYADFIIDLCVQSAHYIQVVGEIAGGNAMVRGTSICTRSAV